ncbi:sugar phosphate isomerase/epimerase family protein [Cohnella silvisoli]|uniref:Sugar phosphate isomerase/epimerase n=1 Tax=Cohnella silvisoli TaxID=2873699 RepID=A0ABV1KQE8_9BACL|nr:sugar phosphate isomerase/epimerase [Cohnella silvisoli]MCD9022017.1 sugar phosphate isomerase/epimerase [Cohnella silvisoli]
MPMKVGCFALIDPFTVLEHQLKRIADMGFRYADITDNRDGAQLGVEFGFAATASLDANPFDLKRLFEQAGLTITTFCAHANLLDPSAPWRYGTSQIIKAIRSAAAIGIEYVITTEGEPSTAFGHNLTEDQKVFSVIEKLQEPLRVAKDHGISLLLEPHGELTDSVAGLEKLIHGLGDPDHLGINLDTGNSWLGGADPVEMAKVFASKIKHVHWKDLLKEMESKRGTTYGCGMSVIPLGTGAIDIEGVYRVLEKAGFNGHTTLEIAGDAAVLESYAYLKRLGAE